MPHNPLGPVCTAACVHLGAAVPNFAWMEVRSSAYFTTLALIAPAAASSSLSAPPEAARLAKTGRKNANLITMRCGGLSIGLVRGQRPALVAGGRCLRQNVPEAPPDGRRRLPGGKSRNDYFVPSPCLSLLTPILVKNDHLPRQARDRHNLKKALNKMIVFVRV